MKILYVTTIGSTMRFFKSFIKELIDSGHTVDIASNENISQVPECYREWGCIVHQINTSRSPLDTGNFAAIKQLQKIVDDGAYQLVHCHTPIAAMCTRLACRKARKNGVKVFYTAHGFHFYKGAPLKNWLLYYPVEKFCAPMTDVLITINQEDYAFAKKKLKAKRVEYVPGTGIDLEKFGHAIVDKAAKRKELSVPEEATLLLSVGELNQNKNHETVIRALAGMDVYYIIAGKGKQQEHLQSLIDELGMSDRIKLLGFRSDIDELCNVSDAYVLPSFREGLNVSVMEAMASGLPCVVSAIRGNVDLIECNVNGFLCAPADSVAFVEAIQKITADTALQKTMKKNNLEKIKKFDVAVINKTMKNIYEVT